MAIRTNIKLPIKQGILNYEQIALSINAIIDSLFWICPALNPDCGKREPPTKFLLDGLLAYSDGTNWDAGSGKGLYYYNLDTTSWVKIG